MALKRLALLFLLLYTDLLYAQPSSKNKKEISFKKITLTTDFISEGVALGDVNHDGRVDIIAGSRWFEAPDWKAHILSQIDTILKTTDFSHSFLNFSMDVNQDGWIDLIRLGYPGKEIVWYENPKNQPGLWKMHPIFSDFGDENPTLMDIDGDGRPDLVGDDAVLHQLIWIKSPSTGDTAWQKMTVSPTGMQGVGQYTHGLGVADMNNDGRPDILLKNGWWESPLDKNQLWHFHSADFGPDCSQIYAMDLNQDGRLDVITASAHDYGIWWHEQVPVTPDSVRYVSHLIFSELSETHALTLADINGDGNPDLVTGKRYFAHNEHDPGALDPAYLYWFEYIPGKSPTWIPHVVDNEAGIGLEVLVSDINGDGLPDIIKANKKGVHVFLQERK